MNKKNIEKNKKKIVSTHKNEVMIKIKINNNNKI